MVLRLLALSPLAFVFACAASQPPAPPPQASATPVEPPPAPVVAAPAAPGPITVDVFTAPDEASAVNSYLVQNDRELIVVDGQMVVPAAQGLVEKIKATKKAPKAFFLTHAHPDHYFGFHALQQAFPGAPVYATAGVKAEFDGAAKGTLEPMKGMLGAAAPTDIAKVTLLEGALELGGEKLEVIELNGGEHSVSAIVRIPSIKAVLAGDHLYASVRNWMKVCDGKTWIGHLEEWKKGDAATTYYPGHGAARGGADLLDANIACIQGFEAEVAKAKGKDEAALVADAMKLALAKFPTHRAPQFLDWTMADYLKCSRPAKGGKAAAPAKSAAPVKLAARAKK
ncbi:MAG: MBL fold metallo-hydrolase [Deltaproteobacteria bacterium]|nr:MBL fold metallo-hydrolase [Deltaproteobacteria bacterium]